MVALVTPNNIPGEIVASYVLSQDATTGDFFWTPQRGDADGFQAVAIYGRNVDGYTNEINVLQWGADQGSTSINVFGAMAVGSLLYGLDSGGDITPQETRPYEQYANSTEANEVNARIMGAASGGANLEAILAAALTGASLTPAAGDRALATLSQITGLNGTDLQRILADGNDADNVTADSAGLLKVISSLVGFNGTNFDRLRTLPANSDAIDEATVGLLGIVNCNLKWNGTDWQRDQANAGFADSTVSVGTTSGQILVADANRTFLAIQNHGSDDVYISFGRPAVVGQGILIPGNGGYWEPVRAHRGAINGIVNGAGAQNVEITVG